MHRAAGAERLAVGTNVVAMPFVPDEVGPREDAVGSSALLPDRDMRRDPFVVDQPAEELTGSVGGIGGKPLGLQREAPLGPSKRVFPTLGSTDFGLPHLHLAKLMVCLASFELIGWLLWPAVGTRLHA